MFRSEVRPIELARKLAREMDEHRTVSVSRMYVPNEYASGSRREDRERYEGVEHEVIDELCAYLLEHARREQPDRWSSRPAIEFHTDERLALGEFGIQARLVRAGGQSEARAGAPSRRASGEHGHTMIYSTSARVREPRRGGARPRAAPRALLVVGGQAPAASRPRGGDDRAQPRLRHRARRRRRLPPPRRDPPGAADGWTIEDLGSTNGVRVNGRAGPRRRSRCSAGDRVELGSTEIVFELG